MWKNKNQRNKIYCGNCGEAGHIYRNCRQPITSFGVILLRNNQKNAIFNPFTDIEFLMIQRKDSISYVEFIRGKYNIDKSDYIKRLFEDMTPTERDSINFSDFKTLWEKLWMNHDSNIFKNEYDSAFEKFKILKNGITNKENIHISIEKFISITNSLYSTPEWEFPKGRRNIREDDEMCAIREFKEETGIEDDSYFIINSIPPFQELFIGSNNIKYRIIYYIGIYTSEKEINVNPSNITQASEIGNIGWVNYANVLNIIKPHFIEKKVITSIFSLFMTITDMSSFKNIVENDEETLQYITSIVSRYHRPLKQFYSKNSKTASKSKKIMMSSDSDDSDKNMQ